MFDDLRPKGAFDEDDEVAEPEIEAAPPPAPKRARRRRSSSGEVLLFGMTAAQRLIISIMLFLNVSVLGCFLLLATSSVVLPF